MNKKDKKKAFCQAIANSRYEYEVLNFRGGEWAHVRIIGYGDVWPATGTVCKDGEYLRDWAKNLAELEALSDPISLILEMISEMDISDIKILQREINQMVMNH